MSIVGIDHLTDAELDFGGGQDVTADVLGSMR